MTQPRAWANIRPMAHRVDPPAFSPFLSRYRNLVERFFTKLKHYRAIATRYEKLRHQLSRPYQARLNPHSVAA